MGNINKQIGFWFVLQDDKMESDIIRIMNFINSILILMNKNKKSNLSFRI